MKIRKEIIFIKSLFKKRIKKIYYKLFYSKLINIFYLININKSLLIFLCIILLIIKSYRITPLNTIELNENYLQLQSDLNLKFNNKINNKIRIGIYYSSIKNGGIERLTALLLNYLDKIKIFDIYLLTQLFKEENEYKIPDNTKRIVIKTGRKKDLLKKIKREKIDILIYHFYNAYEINMLNNFKKIKTIVYNHSCFLIWIYAEIYNFFKTVYNAYKNSKYLVSLVPFENDYLFKKWGINSILMNNFIPYEYNNIIPSTLTSKIILMIGRGSDKMKRYELGIQSMKYIIKNIPDCEMRIISDLKSTDNLKKMIKDLNLENNIKLVGYTSIPEIYFKNASLHIFPTISESFGFVLSETKIYGIPSILAGLDYVSIAKGGTIIIYDDKPKTIANEAIKILNNYNYRKRLGKEARQSMKKFNNDLLLKKWTKLILSIYNGDIYYQNIREQDNKISDKKALNIINNQIKLLKLRKSKFKNITIKNIINFTFMENLNNDYNS